MEVVFSQKFNPEDYYHNPWGKPSGHVYLLSFLIFPYFLICLILFFIGIGNLSTAFLYFSNNASLLGRIVTSFMVLIAGFVIFKIGYKTGNEKNEDYLAILSAFFLAVSNI